MRHRGILSALVRSHLRLSSGFGTSDATRQKHIDLPNALITCYTTNLHMQRLVKAFQPALLEQGGRTWLLETQHELPLRHCCQWSPADGWPCAHHVLETKLCWRNVFATEASYG